MISYAPLLEQLISRNISKTKIKKDLNLSPNTVAKFSTNEVISLDVLDRICEYLNCDYKDVIHHIPNANHEQQIPQKAILQFSDGREFTIAEFTELLTQINNGEVYIK